ncbi:MAG: hypothetical protein ACPF98_05920, partial [Prochlorococcaceae cyanobacterium]
MSVRSPARPQRPASAELQRRRDLRRRKRVHFAAQLWSLLLLLSASAGLGWLLLRHGWLLRTPEQVQLTSRSPFNREQVISAAGLRFPVALLSLDGASLLVTFITVVTLGIEAGIAVGAGISLVFLIAR